MLTTQIDGTDAQQLENAAGVLSELAPAITDPETELEVAIIAPQKPDEDSQAITNLESAIEVVMTKIKWHESKIGDLAEDIRGHKTQIENLRESLRKIVGPVLGQSLTPRPEQEDHSTGNLIMECLRKSKTPLDTKAIKAYLEDRGNETQPSVELSRMVKKGILIRSGRGSYRLK